MGVAFTSMRHLDVAQVASDSPILAEGDGGACDHDPAERGGHNSGSGNRPLNRSSTEESWDEQCHAGGDSGNNAPWGGGEEETRHQLFQVFVCRLRGGDFVFNVRTTGSREQAAPG